MQKQERQIRDYKAFFIFDINNPFKGARLPSVPDPVSGQISHLFIAS
jgi:hypothetical protein